MNCLFVCCGCYDVVKPKQAHNYNSATIAGEEGGIRCKRNTEKNKILKKMKIGKTMNEGLMSSRSYEAPMMEVVEINVERGFELSSGFELGDGTSYDEEDVNW